MGTIHDIVQVGVDVTDRERFEKFACDMLGFPVTRSPDGKITYVRPDQYQHRIAARTASEPALRYVGFDVGDLKSLRNGRQSSRPRGLIGAAAPRWNVSNDM